MRYFSVVCRRGRCQDTARLSRAVLYGLALLLTLTGSRAADAVGCGVRERVPRQAASVGPATVLTLRPAPESAAVSQASLDLVEQYAHRKPVSYYVPTPASGDAYARFPGVSPVLAAISAGGVVAKSNLAAGCALWEWWWHGRQFINDYDYGRQIQVAVYPADGDAALGEAGDVYGVASLQPDARHPSPCVGFATGGSTPSPSVTSAAVPLEWCPEYYGGSPEHPIAYPAVRIGKVLTLNWVGPDGVDRHWPVALFQTVVNSGGIQRATVEAPTGYLNAEFNTYYHYSPASGTLVQDALEAIRAKTARGLGYNLKSPAGAPMAVILAAGRARTAPAMGIYVNDPNTGFVFYDNSIGASPGQAGSNFVKWEVHYDGPITAASWTYDAWIMTDSVQNILEDMNRLYSWAVASR